MKKLTCVAFIFLMCGLVGTSIAADRSGISSTTMMDKPVPAGHPADWKPAARTGGEDCASATVIPSLPYTDDGTTVGAVDDYDEACPYTGSTSGDVVYAFTAPAPMALDVHLCSGITDYDTKLFVYKDVCPDGVPFACNDDSCPAPFLYDSALEELVLEAGSTYYFVVDGYGGDEGNYTIDFVEVPIPEPLEPLESDPLDLLYGQNCDGDADDWSFASSTQAAWAAPGYFIYEDFQTDYFNVCDVHFWGLPLIFNAGFTGCDPTADGGMPFTIGFYADDGAGMPDTAAPICEYTGVVPDRIAQAEGSYAGFDSYKFDVDALPSCCELPASGTVWMLIQSEPMATVDCGFLWGSSGNGPFGNSWQYGEALDPGPWVNTTYERAMCITGDTWPVELQSFSIE